MRGAGVVECAKVVPPIAVGALPSRLPSRADGLARSHSRSHSRSESIDPDACDRVA